MEKDQQILHQILQGKMGREMIDEAVAWIAEEPVRKSLLWDFIWANNGPTARRAVWTLDVYHELYKGQFSPDIQALIPVLLKPCHPAMLRHLVKLLSLYTDIPEAHQGRIFDICLTWIADPKMPVAVKVHAIELAGKIALPYPALLREVETVTEAQFADGTAGLKSRIKSWRKHFARIPDVL